MELVTSPLEVSARHSPTSERANDGAALGLPNMSVPFTRTSLSGSASHGLADR
jgi:hypothetical protein